MLKPLALAAGLAASVGLAAPAAAQTSLSFGYGHPETAIWTTTFLRPWLDAASARIAGGLQHEIFAGGSVMTFAASLEALGAGLVDSSMVTTQFFRSQVPANILLLDIGGTFGNRLARRPNPEPGQIGLLLDGVRGAGGGPPLSPAVPA